MEGAAGRSPGIHGRQAVAAWLEWYALAGVDCCLADPAAEGVPEVRSAPGEESVVPTPPPPAADLFGKVAPPSPLADARRLARSCGTLEELRAALENFEGCALKQTATRLCFADGSAEAPLMLIGEAPGAEEDRQGLPFVGPSGRLLDRILSWIGFDRRSVWITNAIFWRPPGNRAPTTAELAICQPFLERQIELLRPELILFLGGIAARGLLGVREGVTRLRGREFVYRRGAEGPAVPAMVTFHPAYLLRQPAQKRLVWRDFLKVRARLEELAPERLPATGPVAGSESSERRTGAS